MSAAPVNPEAPITRSETILERCKFEATVHPEPRPESAEDVLRLLERDLPEFLIQMAISAGTSAEDGIDWGSVRDQAFEAVFLEAAHVLMSSVRALRTGEWPAWERPIGSARSIGAVCDVLRKAEHVDAEVVIDLLEQHVRAREAEDGEAAR